MSGGDVITSRRRLWLVSVFILAATLAGFWLLPVSRSVREFVLLAGVAAYGIATLLVAFSRCPRCGHLFHDVRGFANPFSPRCAACGESLDEPCGDRDDPAPRR